jgi:hypothetical protein
MSSGRDVLPTKNQTGMDSNYQDKQKRLITHAAMLLVFILRSLPILLNSFFAYRRA